MQYILDIYGNYSYDLALVTKIFHCAGSCRRKPQPALLPLEYRAHIINAEAFPHIPPP